MRTALLRRRAGSIATKTPDFPPKFPRNMLGAYPRSSVERWGAFVHEIVREFAQKTRVAVQEDVSLTCGMPFLGKKFLGHTMTVNSGYVAQ